MYVCIYILHIYVYTIRSRGDLWRWSTDTDCSRARIGFGDFRGWGFRVHQTEKASPTSCGPASAARQTPATQRGESPKSRPRPYALKPLIRF